MLWFGLVCLSSDQSWIYVVEWATDEAWYISRRGNTGRIAEISGEIFSDCVVAALTRQRVNIWFDLMISDATREFRRSGFRGRYGGRERRRMEC